MNNEIKQQPSRSYLWLMWLLPIGYITLLQRTPQMIADAGLIVGILLAIYGGVCLWLLWRYGSQLIRTPFDIGMLAMVSALVVSALFSLDPSRSWRAVWNGTAAIVSFYAAVVFIRSISSPKQLIQALLIAVTFMMVAGYVEFFGWVGRWSAAFGGELWPARVPRIRGINGSPNILGFYLAAGILLAATYRTAAGRWPQIMRLWCVAAVPLLLLARSRSSFLALAAGIAIIIIGRIWINRKGELSSQVVVRMGSGLFILVIVALGAIFFLRPDTSFGEQNISYRFRLWSTAITTWQAHPLSGSGADTFGTFMLLNDNEAPPRIPLRAAHNWWLSILSETGVFGISAALLCWGLLLRFLWHHQRYDNWSWETLGLASSLVVFSVHSFFDTPEHWVVFTAALLFGGFVAALDEQPERVAGGWCSVAVWGSVWICLLAGGYRAYSAAVIYEEGLTTAESGDWQEAAELFDQAQALLPYTESAFALASGYAHGVLAEDEIHRQAAIAAYERLIDAEPGWPTNYANLAALYQLDWQTSAADETLNIAVEMAPQIPIYQLNEARWSGDGLPDSVTVLSDDEIERLENAGWQALEQGEWELAQSLFAAQRVADPYNKNAYLGEGVIAFLEQRPDEAATWLAQADLLGGRDLFWTNLVSENESLEAALAVYKDHSTFGITSTDASRYSRTLFTRPTIDYDLLPWLSCYTTSPLLAQNIRILNNQYIDNDHATELAILESFEGESEDGVRPCVTFSR